MQRVIFAPLGEQTEASRGGEFIDKSKSRVEGWHCGIM